jgi:hypothetical protein
VNPSLRGIRVLNNYLLWHRVSRWFMFPILVVTLTVFAYPCLSLFAPTIDFPFWGVACVLFLFLFIPFVISNRVIYLNRWSGKYSIEGERITLLWKTFRIEFDLSNVVAATYISWKDERRVLVLHVDLSESLAGMSGSYRERGDLPGKTSKTIRVTLPLQGEGWEEVLTWIRAFPGLREKAFPRR